MRKQTTLNKSLYFSGVGLHSGIPTDVKISPAPAGTGFRIQRVDLPDSPVINAYADYVMNTERGTVLCHNNIKISTLEHMMSALFGMGVDNALIQLSGWEVPILDGSALYFAQAIARDGLCQLEEDRVLYSIKSPIHYRDASTGTQIDVFPDDHFSVDLEIDFNSQILGCQQMHYDAQSDYLCDVAPCRTFVFLHEVLYLYRHNLVKGGSLDNALVIAEKEVSQEDMDILRQIFSKPQLEVHKGYLNHLGVYFPNECARHKMLDILGDLSLAGCRFNAHVKAFKPGHGANTAVAKLIREQLFG